MKAINNATGEIVSHFFYSKEFGTISYLDSKNILRVVDARDGEWTILSYDKDCTFCGCSYRITGVEKESCCDEKETIIQDNLDWQSFRAEAAKDILAGMMQHKVLSDSSMTLFVPKEQVVSAAIGLADELIKQLKEKEKNDRL